MDSFIKKPLTFSAGGPNLWNVSGKDTSGRTGAMFIETAEVFDTPEKAQAEALEIARAVAKKMGLPVTFADVRMANQFEGVQAATTDIYFNRERLGELGDGALVELIGPKLMPGEQTIYKQVKEDDDDFFTGDLVLDDFGF